MKKKMVGWIALLSVILLLSGCQTENKVEQTSAPQGEKEKSQSEAISEALQGEIKLYVRDASSGTREAFQEGIGFDKKKDVSTPRAVETTSNGDMAAKVGKDRLALGYVSLTTDCSANGLRTVNFEGVEPTAENVLNGKYGLQRPFSYVTRAKGDFVDQETETLVEAFLVFLNESEEGLSAVESAGGIVNKENAKPWATLSGGIAGFDPTKDYSTVLLRTRGSTSVEKTIKAALEAFQGEVEFQFNMDQTGSGDGYKRTLGEEKEGPNSGDIGFASRPFAEKEDVSGAAWHGSYCQDAVVIVVSKENPLQNMTAEQMKKIVTGEITRWEEIE